MKKLLLLLIPIILITLCGCSDIKVECVYPNTTGVVVEEIQSLDRPDFCVPIYERCIDDYFNDNCLSLYRDWNNIMCEIETWYSIPIRQFKCNVCSWNYWIPINL